MKVLNYIILIVSVATVGSCQTSDLTNGEFKIEGYRSLAVQKYGQGVEFVQNMSGSAVLCVKDTKPTQLNPQHQITFFVYDMKGKNMLFEDTIPNGSVSWNDDSSLIVRIVPGTVRDDDKTPAPRPGYMYDLRTRKTRDLESVDVH